MNSEMKPDEKELRNLLNKLENKALRSPGISGYMATVFIKDEIVTFYKNQLNDAVTNVSNAHIKHEQATSGEFETVYQLVGHLAIKNNPLTETQLELVRDFINEFNEGKTNA